WLPAPHVRNPLVRMGMDTCFASPGWITARLMSRRWKSRTSPRAFLTTTRTRRSAIVSLVLFWMEAVRDARVLPSAKRPNSSMTLLKKTRSLLRSISRRSTAAGFAAVKATVEGGSSRRRLTGRAKFRFCPFADVAVATPTTRPWASNTGPPLLPGLIGAVICRNFVLFSVRSPPTRPDRGEVLAGEARGRRLLRVGRAVKPEGQQRGERQTGRETGARERWRAVDDRCSHVRPLRARHDVLDETVASFFTRDAQI